MQHKTVTTFLNYLTNEKKASANTIESYRRDILSFLAYMDVQAGQDPLTATADTIQKFALYLKGQGKSNNTIARNLSGLRSYYQYLVLTGSIATNPAKTVKFDNAGRKYPEILTNAEVERLLEQPVLNHPKGFRDKAMLELLYATGIRVTELVEMNVSDVNLNLRFVRCRSTRNERMIPLYPAAVQALDEYIKRIRPLMLEEETDALFVNINGMRLTRQGFWKIIKEYAKAANINKDITPQTIRHSFASHLLENGADLKDIQEMLGHQDISSTQFYSKIIKNKYKDVYKKYHPRA